MLIPRQRLLWPSGYWCAPAAGSADGGEASGGRSRAPGLPGLSAAAWRHARWCPWGLNECQACRRAAACARSCRECRRLAGAAGRALIAAIDAVAIVSDDQMRALANASQIDRHPRRCGVAMHVGQRLLYDAQQRSLQRRGQAIGAGAGPQGCLQSRALAEALDITLQGRTQAVAFQLWRVQEIGKCAQLLGGFSERAADFLEQVQSLRFSDDAGLEVRQIEAHRQQM